MNIQMTINLPDTTLAAVCQPQQDFAQAMRLAAAVKWYELQWIAQAKAAEIAGISRQEFLDALVYFQVSPFQVSVQELLEEAERD